MSLSDLPDDLSDLELELTRRRQPPPAGLRNRVMAAVVRELNRPALGERRAGMWQFAAAVAAAMLLAVNLSMSVANNTEWGPARQIDQQKVAALARRIGGLAPQLPEREPVRQAWLLQSSLHVTPLPAARPSPARLRLDQPREPLNLP